MGAFIHCHFIKCSLLQYVEKKVKSRILVSLLQDSEPWMSDPKCLKLLSSRLKATTASLKFWRQLQVSMKGWKRWWKRGFSPHWQLQHEALNQERRVQKLVPLKNPTRKSSLILSVRYKQTARGVFADWAFLKDNPFWQSSRRDAKLFGFKEKSSCASMWSVGARELTLVLY